MAGKSSRTENTTKNAVASMIAQVITAILQFVCRSVFIRCLGNSYLSFDGLFSNILTMLSLAELGFGEAIIFCLYKPLAINDDRKIKALMDYYAKIYRIVAVIVLGLGLAIIPFLTYIMKDPPQVPESLCLIYILFLLNSVASYLLVYKQSILIADQKNYIVSSVKMVVSIATMALQIAFLFITHNYIAYLLITIFTTLIMNIYVSIVANKKYPILKSKEEVALDKETKGEITTNVKALMVYKVGTMLVTGVDNLLISSFIGVLSVGLYSNYSLVINKASTILRSVITSATGSVGNLGAMGNKEHSERIGRVMLFITFWLFGYASVGMFVLINPFIKFMAGEEYLFDMFTVLFLVVDFYLLGVNSPMNVFRNAFGLYRYGKYRPMMCALANLVVSLLLIKPFGITGIVMGTLAARLGVTSWYEPFIVYKYGLGLKTRGYLLKFFAYLSFTLACCGLCYFICIPFEEYTIFSFVVKAIIVTAITNGLIVLVFRKTEEFKYAKGMIASLFKKIFGRKNEKKVL